MEHTVFSRQNPAPLVRALRLAGVVFATGLIGCATLQQVPADGRYDGELCVSAASGAPNCGTAEVSLFKGRAKVRVSDIVYNLQLEDGQLELMLVHGSVLVDAFSTTYSWDRRFLRFVDVDRRVYYRVRFANAPSHALVPASP